MPALIRPATAADAAAICAIYNPYITDTIITFEQVPVTTEEMEERMRLVQVNYPWLVAELDGDIVAYAYATRWRTRAAYDLTAEVAIYVRRGLHGVGIGKPLYIALLDALEKQGIHAVIGGISLPNPASVVFHERCGFTKVAHFPQVGRKFDRWIDVGFWHTTLGAPR